MSDHPFTRVRIVADSATIHGVRITTFELTYPRYIHAEFMTHRQFSRNAQSTRAIPTKKRIERVRNNPVTPIRWEKNQKGMVAKNEEVDNLATCADTWISHAEEAADCAEDLTNLGLHKQWAGRMLEPFDTITVICTATDYDNFFALRCAPDAQPEINDLAWKMADAYYGQRPQVLEAGDWHLPYVDNAVVAACEEFDPSNVGSVLKKVSAARCARVSYLNHDGTVPDIAKDVALHDMLVKSGHMTPLEHQATPVTEDRYTSGNFRSWMQYRKTVPGELRSFDYAEASKHR